MHFVAEFGRMPPRSKCGIYYGVNLGEWAENQRKSKRGLSACKMTPTRVRTLESIPGWYWERNFNAVRQRNLSRVSKVERLPSCGYYGTSLESWIQTQRAAEIYVGNLGGESKLEGIFGRHKFQYLHATWQQNADLVRAYEVEFGRLPPQGKRGIYLGVNLGTWVSTQRQAKKGKSGCKLTLERERELESIPGWFWILDTTWQRRADLLRSYVVEFGYLPSQNKSGVYHGVNLGTWVSTQRAAKKCQNGRSLSLDRERELNTIPGWYW